jgi:hypothetical protein
VVDATWVQEPTRRLGSGFNAANNPLVDMVWAKFDNAP